MFIDGSHLATWLGRNFRDFCRGGHTPNSDTTFHCAHFVSHAARYSSGSQVRVHELARACQSSLEAFPGVRWDASSTGNQRPQLVFSNRQTALCQPSCLIYISNWATSDVGPGSDPGVILSDSIEGGWTHVGFFVGGFVYHYENHDCMECVVVQPLEDFMHRYSQWWPTRRRRNSRPPVLGNRLWRSGLPPGSIGTHNFALARRRLHNRRSSSACRNSPPDNRDVTPPQVLARTCRVPSNWATQWPGGCSLENHR